MSQDYAKKGDSKSEQKPPRTSVNKTAPTRSVPQVVSPSSSPSRTSRPRRVLRRRTDAWCAKVGTGGRTVPPPLKLSKPKHGSEAKEMRFSTIRSKVARYAAPAGPVQINGLIEVRYIPDTGADKSIIHQGGAGCVGGEAVQAAQQTRPEHNQRHPEEPSEDNERHVRRRRTLQGVDRDEGKELQPQVSDAWGLRQLRYVYNNLREPGSIKQDPNAIDQLQAMKWSDEIWHEVTGKDTIKNCFRHTSVCYLGPKDILDDMTSSSYGDDVQVGEVILRLSSMALWDFRIESAIDHQLAQIAGHPLLGAEEDEFPVGDGRPNEQDVYDPREVIDRLVAQVVTEGVPANDVEAVRRAS
ncbi:unnamed protein product [Phytophthora fragariaefolia]|uniref:Unnamed protein product n=1 Tax=Phytophthora fragariaefolia TaxID=1490495 RepID=A0A9W6Y8M7_9STRA|nr:unnamed protein product [Phytophthora fragariaefolia]